MFILNSKMNFYKYYKCNNVVLIEYFITNFFIIISSLHTFATNCTFSQFDSNVGRVAECYILFILISYNST